MKRWAQIGLLSSCRIIGTTPRTTESRHEFKRASICGNTHDRACSNRTWRSATDFFWGRAMIACVHADRLIETKYTSTLQAAAHRHQPLHEVYKFWGKPNFSERANTFAYRKECIRQPTRSVGLLEDVKKARFWMPRTFLCFWTDDARQYVFAPGDSLEATLKGVDVGW